MCAAGTVDERACGYCDLGTEERTCRADCTWGSWGTCVGGGECEAGTEETGTCGACDEGTQSRACRASCSWGAWSDCAGTVCEPGEEDTGSCGNCDAGTRTRTCTSLCEWGDWGDCSVGGFSSKCLGCSVDIGASGDDDHLDLAGWFGRGGTSPTARWTRGTDSGMVYLGVSKSARTVSVSWSSRIIDDKCDPVTARTGSLHIDGIRFPIDITTTGFHTEEFTIPPGETDDEWLRVRIRADWCHVPAICSPPSTDDRCLGIRVDSVSACP